jgi:NAD(P)-dependent dehydrogenase (short-subunit alcohol dehydrogenase family)
MHLHLENQIAVVIGGASGIGLAIAKQFASENCRVAIIDKSDHTETLARDTLTRDTLARSASEGNSSPTALGIRADVTDYAALQSAAARVTKDLGPAHHVIYAAGMGSGKFGFPFWNLEPADWDRVYRVNLLGAVHAAHAFAPTFVEHKRGTMLFISSVAGQIGSQTDPPYSAAKGGLINFAMCVAKDFAPYGVRVNTICPGMVQTPLNRGVWQSWNEKQPADKQLTYDEWGLAKVRQMCPLGQWQTPDQIAATIAFLASPHAATITGQTINIDGGWVMHW